MIDIDIYTHPAEAGPRAYIFYKIMNIYLQAKPEDIKAKFFSLSSRKDVANILEIQDSFLRKILYGVEERKKYRIFEIQKKSCKPRQISAPPKNLAILQSKLNSILKLVYEPKYCAHGFIVGKTILSNAEKHISKKHLINIDLQDFFPSIYMGRVKGAFMSPPFNIGQEAATVIAQISCKDDDKTRDSHLFIQPRWGWGGVLGIVFPGLEWFMPASPFAYQLRRTGHHWRGSDLFY